MKCRSPWGHTATLSYQWGHHTDQCWDGDCPVLFIASSPWFEARLEREWIPSHGLISNWALARKDWYFIALQHAFRSQGGSGCYTVWIAVHSGKPQKTFWCFSIIIWEKMLSINLRALYFKNLFGILHTAIKENGIVKKKME